MATAGLKFAISAALWIDLVHIQKRGGGDLWIKLIAVNTRRAIGSEDMRFSSQSNWLGLINWPGQAGQTYWSQPPLARDRKTRSLSGWLVTAVFGSLVNRYIVPYNILRKITNQDNGPVDVSKSVLFGYFEEDEASRTTALLPLLSDQALNSPPTCHRPKIQISEKHT